MIASTNNGALMRMLGGALIVVTMLVVAGCGEIYGHDEFHKLVMNKPETEVITSIGKPVAVDSSNPARVTWTYNQLTYDIDNQNKKDTKTVLVLAPDAAADGKLKVIEILYNR